MMFQRLGFTYAMYCYKAIFTTALPVLFSVALSLLINQQTAVSCQTALCCSDFPPRILGAIDRPAKQIYGLRSEVSE